MKLVEGHTGHANFVGHMGHMDHASRAGRTESQTMRTCGLHRSLGSSKLVLGLGISGYPRTGPVGKNITEPDLESPENIC